MKILIFHGYLLAGTGSNVYNVQLSRALVRAGHEVHLLSQERTPERLSFVDAHGSWDGGAGLRLHGVREPARCTVYRPDVGGLLPVYVADRYEGFEARTFLDCTDEEVAAYVARNVAAVREVAERVRPDVALANHLVMGPAILARGLAGLGVPYAVKVHGSALEYVVKRDPERFLPWAREGLAPAKAVLVGSRHTAESLWEAMGDPSLPERTRLGPPGVDVEAFAPAPPAEAAARLRALAESLLAAEPEPAAEGSSFARDVHAAGRELARLDPGRERLVVFVGKLIVSKGVDLLAAAWPLVLRRVADATLVVVGFGAYREGFERLLAALRDGDLDAARDLALRGRAVEGGPHAPLRHLLAHLDSRPGPAPALADRVRVVGRLEHDELHELLPACDAQVVPSTFPEAFGMVAAEGAACGVLPVSAAHSGLAEVSAQLAEAVPPEAAPWLSFPVGDGAVGALADRIASWLEAPEPLRARTRAALVATARERFSWDGVARDAIAAAQGRLDTLRPVARLR
ncbi:MAG TPA: glycosyltransferase family 4 protein [Solirubrobacteraceae bacterium]|jgi:glycosyltransferase involved in cell wall biosynthesis|nr:glycosyltransferase family 4 protein [Solirubrobacteraceae bacterium]